MMKRRTLLGFMVTAAGATVVGVKPSLSVAVEPTQETTLTMVVECLEGKKFVFPGMTATFDVATATLRLPNCFIDQHPEDYMVVDVYTELPSLNRRLSFWGNRPPEIIYRGNTLTLTDAHIKLT